jgi:hypothetical protein
MSLQDAVAPYFVYRRAGALLFLAASSGLAPAGEPERVPEAIASLPPGHWYEVPNSRLIDVTPKPVPPGVSGPVSVMSEWSSGAYDTRRQRLLVWGGGHSGYSGNEVYAFDMRSLRWQRLTEPSRDVGGDPASGYYPDGLPRSRHTYDYVEYVPATDSFCSFGGAALYPEGGVIAANTDCLDLKTLKWQRKADALSYGIGALSAHDPKGGRVWVHGAGRDGFMTSYDPVTDRWIVHDQPRRHAWLDYEMTAEIDPVRRKFVAIGRGHFYMAELTDSGFSAMHRVKGGGALEIVRADSPGLAFHPPSGQLVGWMGGPQLYLLDPESLVWTVHRPAASNRVTPGPAAEAGTYSRFRYSEALDVFVVVSDVNRNVFLYRMPRRPQAN